MPPTPGGSYRYTPKTFSCKPTSQTGAAAALVGQVIAIDETPGERDTDDQKFIGLEEAVSIPMGKGSKEITLTLKAISPDFETMCRNSYNSPAVTLTMVLVSEGINIMATGAPDVVQKTTTYIGYVSSELAPTSRSAGETEEYTVTVKLTAAPTVAIAGGVA